MHIVQWIFDFFRQMKLYLSRSANLRWICFSLTIFLCEFGPSDHAQAQCSNAANLSCNVYNTCFDRYCPCSGNDNYFIAYGRKYCDRFLNAAGLSNAGKQWRDKTLRCLQETIVPKLPIDAPKTCNCGQMKTFAFQSHVACYTQASASVCKLPLSDWQKIAQIIDSTDLFDKYGASQILEVVKICISNYSDGVADDIKAKWSQAKAKLESYISN